MTSTEVGFELDQLDRGRFPSLSSLIATLLEVWPDHKKFLSRSFEHRSTALLASSELVACMILDLEGNDLKSLCIDYQWMCARLQEEEIEFRRNNHYRRTSFAEVEEEVYSNSSFMTPYLRGLLLSQVVWFNHASVIDFYLKEFIPSLPAQGRLLEVGPGHGLLLGLAATYGHQASISGWDVSPTSVASTEVALKKLRVTKPIEFRTIDISRPITGQRQFDSIVLSEVLEHLEEPAATLENLRNVLAPGGRLFVNVPINSPAPDHIFLLRSIEESIRLVEQAGYTVVNARHFPTGGYTRERAQRLGVTISSTLIVQKGLE